MEYSNLFVYKVNVFRKKLVSNLFLPKISFNWSKLFILKIGAGKCPIFSTANSKNHNLIKK
jgi:hypothetical protein